MIKKQVIFYQGVIEPVLIIPAPGIPTVDMWEIYNYPPRIAKPYSLKDRTVHFIIPSVYPFTWDWEFYNKPPRRAKLWPPAAHMNRFQRSSGLNLDDIEVVELKSYALRNPIPYSKNMGQHSQYLINDTLSISDTVFTALRIYYIPIVIPYPVHVQEIGITITERDDSTQTRLGIFASERGIITDLIYSNIIQNNTTGYRAVAANIQLPKGFFFLAFMTESSILDVKDAGIFEVTFLPHSTPLETKNNTHYFNDISTFSDGFSDDPDVTLANGTVPTIWVRI